MLIPNSSIAGIFNFLFFLIKLINNKLSIQQSNNPVVKKSSNQPCSHDWNVILHHFKGNNLWTFIWELTGVLRKLPLLISIQGESVCVDTVSCWNSPYTDMLNIGSPRSRKQWLSLSTIYLRFDRRQETMQHVNPTNTPAHSKKRDWKGENRGEEDREDSQIFMCFSSQKSTILGLLFVFNCFFPIFHFLSYDWTHLNLFHKHCGNTMYSVLAFAGNMLFVH